MLFDFPFEFSARKLRPVAYAYEAGIHCLKCAEGRFGADPLSCHDREGNPVHPEYETDDQEWCLTCYQLIAV